MNRLAPFHLWKLWKKQKPHCALANYEECLQFRKIEVGMKIPYARRADADGFI